MGGNRKGGLSVLWMPRKKKHHHHKRQENPVFKSGKGRIPAFGAPGHSASGTTGILLESRPENYVEKPTDIKLLHVKTLSDGIDNPSTSTDADHNAIENDATDTAKANESNDDEYLEKSEDSTDTTNLKNQKDDTDSDGKQGLGFECVYCVFHCCDCTIS